MRVSRTRQMYRAERDRVHRRQKHHKVLGVGLCVCLAITLAAVVTADPGRRGGSAAAPAPKTDAVREVLHSLRSPWAQREPELVLREDLTTAQYTAVLDQVLEDPEDPLFGAAVFLAVHLGVGELAVTMRQTLATADPANAAKLVAGVERLDPWTDEELETLLAADDEAVVEAALAVAAARKATEKRHVAAIADLVTSAAPGVRAAALQALPGEMPQDVATQLAGDVLSLEGDRFAQALVALARTASPEVADPLLYGRLGAKDTDCAAALRAFIARGTTLARPEAVLAVADDPNKPLQLRALALECFDRTGTTEGVERLETMWQRHPVLDYLGGRLLVSAARRSGLRMLVDVASLEVDDPQLIGSGDLATARLGREARMGARQVLAQLSGTSIAAGPAEWEAWIAGMPDLVRAKLPPLQLSLRY